MTKIRFISLDQLLEMQTNNEKFKLVEVLDRDNFTKGHIPGAINLPLQDIEKLAKKTLKKTEKIIVYCASYSCHASTNAAALLLKLGYKKTFDFKGSKKLWFDSGLAIEK